MRQYRKRIGMLVIEDVGMSKLQLDLIKDAPVCLACGKRMIFVKEYAKGHFSFFCEHCKEWRYIP